MRRVYRALGLLHSVVFWHRYDQRNVRKRALIWHTCIDSKITEYRIHRKEYMGFILLFFLWIWRLTAYSVNYRHRWTGVWSKSCLLCIKLNSFYKSCTLQVTSYVLKQTQREQIFPALLCKSFFQIKDNFIAFYLSNKHMYLLMVFLAVNQHIGYSTVSVLYMHMPPGFRPGGKQLQDHAIGCECYRLSHVVVVTHRWAGDACFELTECIFKNLHLS